MSVRTIEEILKAAGKTQPDPSSLGANDVIVAAAIIAQALDRHAEAVHNLAATIKIIGEKPKASTS
jgi:hypothetical protein